MPKRAVPLQACSYAPVARRNDEARMTNDQGMAKLEFRGPKTAKLEREKRLSDFVIISSFGFRHFTFAAFLMAVRIRT
jgi:hypothetical protein